VGVSFDPAVILLIAAAEVLYVRGVSRLRRRGYAVPAWQQAAWHTGIALTAIGLLSPIDGLGEELLSAHMAQHLLIADLSVPFLLVGLHSPMHVWFLPRPATVALARSRLRPVFRKLRRPLVAIAIWILILYGWHFSFMFEAALRSDLLHALQHETFVLGALLIWWPVVEPKRRRAPGELWKIGHIVGARLAGMFLGMAFVLMSSPAYEGFYGDAARGHGLSPLTDQQIAGGMMLGLDLLVMLATVAFFFYRSAEDHDRAAARAAALSVLVLLALGLGSCGGGEDGQSDEEVIRGWITALNEGEFGRAASYFAQGAVIEQAEEVRLRSRSDAIAFNRSLPCRADLTDVDEEGRTTLAAFRLREGRDGRCGPGEGAGESARVRFVIRDGRIREWRQLPEEPLPQGDAV
jgi:putative copper resistance protein D